MTADFLLPPCSPRKVFETWGSAPDPAPGGGPFFLSLSLSLLLFSPRSDLAPKKNGGEAEGRKGGRTETTSAKLSLSAEGKAEAEMM